jgi:hypothetical protein
MASGSLSQEPMAPCSGQMTSRSCWRLELDLGNTSELFACSVAGTGIFRS